jgi:hypothetical protein
VLIVSKAIQIAYGKSGHPEKSDGNRYRLVRLTSP